MLIYSYSRWSKIPDFNLGQKDIIQRKKRVLKQDCVRVLLSYLEAVLKSDIMHANKVVHKQRNLAI